MRIDRLRHDLISRSDQSRVLAYGTETPGTVVQSSLKPLTAGLAPLGKLCSIIEQTVDAQLPHASVDC